MESYQRETPFMFSFRERQTKAQIEETCFLRITLLAAPALAISS